MASETDNFLGFADVFQVGMKKTRDAIEGKGPEFLGTLYHAHTACIACIASILSRPDRVFPIEELQTKLRRASVHAAVCQGIHAIEYLIAVGCYAQASSLVRQEIEAVESLRGIRLGYQKDGTTPRLKALRHLGKYYGQLTGIAHMSSHDLLTHVVSNSVGNIDHCFNPDFARVLFGLHVTALVGVALDMAEFRPAFERDLITDEEDWWLSAACGVLVEEGLLPVRATC